MSEMVAEKELCGLSDEDSLRRCALRIRWGIIRAIKSNNGGHIGGSMDLAEVLAVLYSDFIRVNPKDPLWPDRDFMILSKGHAGPALYSALSVKGFFSEDLLDNLNNPNSKLPGHADRTKVPGVDATTGSLGQGLSISVGVALSSKVKKKGQKVFCIIGDGESAEGQIWEAAQSASHYHLDNLIAFMDWNKMQIDGTNDEVMSLGKPVDKFVSFGWDSVLVKGDDVMAIQDALREIIKSTNGKPKMIVLDTIKGNGAKSISSMKNNHCIAFPENLSREVVEELNEQARALKMEVH